MLFVELKYSEDENGREIFLNGYYPRKRLERELEVCFLNKREQMTSLLEKGKLITQDVVIEVKTFTKVTSRSEWADEIKFLNRGDKIILHSDATYEIKPSFINRIKEFIQSCIKKNYQF